MEYWIWYIEIDNSGRPTNVNVKSFLPSTRITCISRFFERTIEYSNRFQFLMVVM